MTMTPAEYAYTALDAIDADPTSWVQGVWAEDDCGTAGCIARHIANAAGHPEGSYYYVADGAAGHVADHAAQLLGYDTYFGQLPKFKFDCYRDCYRDLFDAGNTREDLGVIVEKMFGPRPESLRRNESAASVR